MNEKINLKMISFRRLFFISQSYEEGKADNVYYSKRIVIFNLT